MKWRGRRPNAILIVALAVTAVYGSVAGWRRANRPPGEWVGRTNCAWFSPPTIIMAPGHHQPQDSAGAMAHERVHAWECSELGPFRYRWRTLFASSNLALETPAYCAGAAERARFTGDTAFSRASIITDMMAGLGDESDSVTIRRAIVTTCPAFAPPR